jgi:hypothetical protein
MVRAKLTVPARLSFSSASARLIGDNESPLLHQNIYLPRTQSQDEVR